MRLKYATYAEAKARFTWQERWDVFSGDRRRFNIAYECVDRHPREKEAIRLQFDDGRRETYTFGELSTWSSRFAHMLARRGVGRGEAVALVVNPSFEFYVAFFGTLKRGAVVVPCSALFGPDAIELRVRNAHAKMIVAAREKASLVPPELVGQVIVAEELRQLTEKEPDRYEPDTSPDDLAVIQFSSGTTGTPKPVPYRHVAATVTAVYMRFAAGLRNDDRYFCPSSPAWGHGIWYGTVGPLIFGKAIGAYSGRFNPEILLTALQEFGITNVFATPFVFRSIMTCGRIGSFRLNLRDMTRLSPL